MATIAEFKAQNPAYAEVDDQKLADALHSKYYADTPKDEFYSRVGLTPEPGLVQRALDAGGPPPIQPPPSVDDQGGLTRRGVMELSREHDPIGNRLPSIAEASGQALQNVPENLETGRAGLALAGAEREAQVSRSDTQATGEGAAKLAATRDVLQQKMTALETAPRDQRDALQSDIATLRQLEGQLALLYEDAAEIAVGETRQARAADAKAMQAAKDIVAADRNMVPVNAEPGSAEYYIANAIGSSAEMAPALLASVVTRSAIPSMTFMTGYSGGRSYASGRAEGLSPDEARGYATLTAIAEGIPEALPVAVMLKPGANILTRMAKGAAAETAQESLTEALQVSIDRGYIEPDMTWGEARQRIIDAGIIGGIAGGVMGGGVDLTQRALGTIASASQSATTGLSDSAQRILGRLSVPVPKPQAPRTAPTAPQQPGQRVPEGNQTPEGPARPVLPPLVAEAFSQGGAELAGAPANWPEIKAGIFAGESHGDYDALFGFSNRPGGPFEGVRITEMTVDEAITFADPSGPYGQWVKGQIGRVATPMGGFQIVGTTLRSVKEGLGLTGTEQMTPALQERMGLWILQNQGTGAWEGYQGPRQPGDIGTAPDTYSGSIPTFAGEQTSSQVASTDPDQGGGNTASGSTSEAAPTLPEVQTPEIATPEPVPAEPVVARETPSGSEAPVSAPQTPLPDTDATQTTTPAAPAPVEVAAQDVEVAPTEAQKEAGNYKKGHTNVLGLDITIENAKGSERSGRDDGGNEWSVTMPAHYGYIKRTEGADGDHVDVYIGENPDSETVFIVDQVDPRTNQFDEHKVIMGVADKAAATDLYVRGFSDGSGPKRMGAMAEISADDFKAWLKDGDNTKPFTDKRRAPVPQYQEVVDAILKGDPTAQVEERVRAIIRMAGGRATKNDHADGAFKSLDDNQKADALALAQADAMPNEPTARNPSKKARKPARPKPISTETGKKVSAAEVELGRKTAIQKLKDAAKLIEQKIERGDDTHTVVTLTTPSGRKTTFRFHATEAGRDMALRTLAEWKKKSQRVLALRTPDALQSGLHLDMPMPNHQPMWRNLTPPVLSGDTITVADVDVKLPPMHRPVRRDAIRTYAEGLMGARVYQSKVKGKAVAGFYRRKNGELRLSKFDDIEVLAHEMAHWMDFNSTMGGRFNTMRKKATKKARDEMKALSYTSDPKVVSSEGFAEFIRLWLTQYEAAKAKAPTFLAEFEAELTGTKGFDKKFRRLQAEMHKYFHQGALAQARANIGEDESVKTATRKFVQSRPIGRLRQQAIDRLHGIKLAEREVTGGVATGDASAYKLMQMVNGAGALYDTIIEDGTPQLMPDGSIARRGKSLNEVFAPVYKMGAAAFDDFMTYAAGRRAQELAGQDRENLFSEAQIASMLELERDGFADVFADFQTFNGELLEFYEDMGLITFGQRADFALNNQSYVPFHRVAETLETGRSPGSSKIGKRLRGGDRNVRDIADNIVEGIMTNVRQAMIARAKRRLYQTLTTSDQGAKFATKIGTDSKKVKAHTEEMAQKVAEAMAELGFGISSDGQIIANPEAEAMTDIEDIADILRQRPDLLQFWQHNLPPTTKGTLVDSAIINGKVQYFEIIDPVLIDSLLGNEMMDMGFVVRGAHVVKNFITRTITTMPPFMVPNIVRDTLTAGTMSDSGFRPGVDSVRGLVQIITQSDTYTEWKRQGGGYSSLVQATTGDGKGRASLKIPQDWHHPVTVLSKTLAAWDSVASLFENSTRVGEFMRALEKGETKTEAAWRAREVSTDFARRAGSSWWSALMQTVPFMNAALQGNDRMLRAFTGEDARLDKRAAMNTITRLTTKVGAGMAAFTAILWWINRDDERYQQLTPDQKSRFWHIFLPGEGSLQIPKPYGMGFIFADVVENALDRVASEQGESVARNLAWSAGHHFWFFDYPGIMQPTIEALKNETFTGAPVVPVYMEDRSPENQFTDRTPEIYQRLGDRSGLSPLRMQHYSRGFLGYLELAFVDLTETMLWDEEAFGERPYPRGVDDYFFKQFKGAPFPYRTKYTEQYYELRQRARTAAADLSALQENVVRKPDRLKRFAGDTLNVALAELNRDFLRVDKELSAMRDGINAIKYNPKMSKAEKEQQIEDLYRARNDVLKKVYSAISKAVDDMEEETKP